MKKLVVIAFIGFISLSSFSQSGPADKAQIPGSNSVAQRPTSVATADPAYTIGAEDVINIAVWKEPDFSATVPVRPDGKVSLALIGDIQAAGRTPAEMAEDLTALLKKYIAEPRVTVMVTAMNSRRVFLLGEISRPGPIVITPAMNVLQAIAAAGGPTAYANSKKCYVLRTVNGTQTKLPFNYKEALKGNSPEQNVLLKSGDTIVVP